MSWEFCITRLRESDLKKEVLDKSIDDVENEGNLDNIRKNLEYISGPEAKIDRNKTNKGINLLFYAFRNGTVRTNSWAFPGYIVIVFLVVSTLFFVLGAVLPFILESEYWFELLICTLFVAWLQHFMWKKFFGKYYTLMTGSATVDAFCWKFLPSRLEYLKSQNIEADYKVLQSSLGSFEDYAHQQDVCHPDGKWKHLTKLLHLVFGDAKKRF